MHAIKQIFRTACRQNGIGRGPALPAFSIAEAPRYCHPPVVHRYGPEGPVVLGAPATSACQQGGCKLNKTKRHEKSAHPSRDGRFFQNSRQGLRC